MRARAGRVKSRLEDGTWQDREEAFCGKMDALRIRLAETLYEEPGKTGKICKETQALLACMSRRRSFVMELDSASALRGGGPAPLAGTLERYRHHAPDGQSYAQRPTRDRTWI